MINSGMEYPGNPQKTWQRDSTTGRLESIDSTDMANSAQTVPDDLQASWSSYTVKKIKGVGSFFANRLRYGVIGSAHGLIASLGFAVALSSVAKLRSKPLGNTTGGISFTIPFAITAAVLEEVLFRGIIQNGIYHISSFVFNKLNIQNSENKAFWTAIVPTALSFGLLHLSNPTPSLVQAACNTVYGFHYGYLAQSYGLETAMWAHAAVNFAGAGGLDFFTNGSE